LSRICSVTLQRVILTRKEENKDHRIASSIDSFRVWPLPAQQKMHDTQVQIDRNLDSPRCTICRCKSAAISTGLSIANERSNEVCPNKRKERTHARTPLHIQAPGASLATGVHTQKKISRNSSGIIHRGEG
jgi:hypothetical protein